MTTDTGVEETRQRIIRAALKLFGEVGYTRATTRAIADRAGINEVTLFRHFGSKRELLLACLRAGNQTGFARTFREHLTGDYPSDIRVMARLQIADTQQNLGILRLLLCDAQAVPDLQEVLALGAAGNRQQLAAYFAEQIAAGVVRADLNPLLLAQAFDSLFSSHVLFEHFMGSTPLPALPAEDVVESLAGLFIRGTLVE